MAQAAFMSAASLNMSRLPDAANVGSEGAPRLLRVIASSAGIFDERRAYDYSSALWK